MFMYRLHDMFNVKYKLLFGEIEDREQTNFLSKFKKSKLSNLVDNAVSLPFRTTVSTKNHCGLY